MSGTPGPVPHPSSTRSPAVGTGTFDPLGMDMSAPIECLRAGPRIVGCFGSLRANLMARAPQAHDRAPEITVQPAVTHSELGLYTIASPPVALFRQFRSD
ncbi:hypothetical protein GCM10010515_27680 [Streptomyces fructofermentans]|uniref:Uncharacterized protein n=1 Tax=Streptomyces fructofermentans TaxID=152141 RepID=A0A918NCY7_9ACTN|nr:hypothetical protein GCM10010515_27680 [Streptomyces fructofermentans]